MDASTAFEHVIRGVILVGGTVLLQLMAQFALSRTMRAWPSQRLPQQTVGDRPMHLVVAVLILMIGMLFQVALWAAISGENLGPLPTLFISRSQASPLSAPANLYSRRSTAFLAPCKPLSACLCSAGRRRCWSRSFRNRVVRPLSSLSGAVGKRGYSKVVAGCA
jgi:hypothetical protein